MAAPLFDRYAQNYDRARYQLVPCLEELYGTVVALLPFKRDASFEVLDLGAGTGLLSAHIAAIFPYAQITLFDESPGMLESAHARFGHESRIHYRVGDYAREMLPGSYDAVVSALSIHHLTEYDKRHLFQRVLRALPVDGVFINADQVLGPTPEIENRYQQQWVREAKQLGVSPQDLEASLERQKADQCSTMEDQLVWMRESGFRNVNCWYKNGRFAVMAGDR
jgi:tRNA (cmo5U34)-methyltransferase